jgi:hypothetical protein
MEIFFATDNTDFKEQRICVKFLFNLKKNSAKTHRMLQEAFRDNATSQNKTFYGTKTSRTDKHLSMTTTRILDDRQQAQHWKT